jgi:hypothetical protein
LLRKHDRLPLPLMAQRGTKLLSLLSQKRIKKLQSLQSPRLRWMPLLLPYLTPRTLHFCLQVRGANPTPKARGTLRASIAGPHLTSNGIIHGLHLSVTMSPPGHSPLKARAAEMVNSPKGLTPRHCSVTFIRSLDILLTGASTIPTVLVDHLPLMTDHGVNHAIDMGILQTIVMLLPFV